MNNYSPRAPECQLAACQVVAVLDIDRSTAATVVLSHRRWGGILEVIQKLLHEIPLSTRL